MATKQDRAVQRQINTLFNMGVVRDLTDGQLLERFSTGQGEAGELAFAALVERHGPMVLRVCRARLSDPHDALDAFQATFLVLVEKARGLWVRDSLGPWLHKVACRTATCSLATSARRRRIERRAAELAVTDRGDDSRTSSEWEQVLHEEINRLPERYRISIVLCDLEGNTCEEAARRMGRPVGTVKSWRARGRERLRQRLIRAGLTPSVGLEAALAADVTRAAVQAMEAEKASQALADCLIAGEVPASLRVLVKGVLKSMFLSKLNTTAAVICALVLVVAGVGTVARVAAENPKGPGADAPSAAPRPTAVSRQVQPIGPAPPTLAGETWPITLREAVRIGLEHTKAVRVLAPGATGTPVGGFEPTPLKTDSTARATDVIRVIATNSEISSHRLKAEIMAHVRSVEQQYWNLAQQHVQLWSAEKAVELAREMVNREQAAMAAGKGTAADVAEAQQRLEQFNLDLVTRTSDVITTERQLRFLLGLPAADNRRIIPVTPPTDARIEPDWDASLAMMLESQPDVVQAKEKAEATQTDIDKVAQIFLPDLGGQGVHAVSSGPERGKSAVLESASLQQVTHQATHSMARFFLEIDSNYKQYQTAKKLRVAATERLGANRAHYEEGRITIDRFLDSVSQYAAAVAMEAQLKSNYNVSIVALEEAKGTLLDYDKITVVERPVADKPVAGKPDGAVMAAAIDAQAPAGPALSRESRTEIVDTKAPGPRADSGRTISFQVTVNVGSKPVEIRGSLTVSPAESLDRAKTP